MTEYLAENSEIKIIENIIGGSIALSVVLAIPSFYLLSHVLITLIYKAITVKLDKNKRLLINEDKRFFAEADIRYCIDLINKKTDNSESKSKLKQLFKRLIYVNNKNFKYSSRIVNAHVVGFLTIYYFYVIWMYSGIRILNYLEQITSSLSKNFILSNPFLKLQNKNSNF